MAAMTRLQCLLTSLLLTVAAVFPAVAQRHYSPNFAIGAKGGMTLSRMSFSPKTDQTWLSGVTAGLQLRYTEERHVGIIAELNLTQRGWRESYEPGENFSYKRTLTYIQLPLMTHIFFGSRKFKGFVNLGPEIGYMIGSKITADFDYSNISSVPGYPQGYRVSEQLNMDISNRFDYGIAAGIGMEAVVRRRHSIMLEGRFYYGLGNIFPSAKKDYFSASRSMSVEITLGYLFRLR